jgi:hypothetical protein
MIKNKKNGATALAEPTAEMDALLRDSGNLGNREKALAATHELAKAIETPLRQGVLYGDVLAGIFQAINFPVGTSIEFPLDFLAPGTEKNHVAYSIPNHGRIPERHIEGDRVVISTYEIASSIDWLLKYSRDARWDIVGRAMQVLQSGFTKKLNDDGFAVLLAAAVDRNIVVYDSAAAAGAFTKRLISLMQQVMRRSSGGNSTSLNRGRLTDVFMSPEALEDVRNWVVADIDEVTRREIFTAEDGRLNRIFGVNLHDLDEFGEGQQYQNFYLNELGGTLASADEELVLGLDLSESFGGPGTFIMPIREPLQIFEDDNFHRQRRASLYGWMEVGFGNLDNRKLVLGSL